MKNNNSSAFTLVELIVVATILIILATIGFAAYSDNIPDARDAERISSIGSMKASLELHKKSRWAYPFPGERFDIKLGASNPVAYQGKFNKDVRISNMDRLPMDPKSKKEFLYSVTKNRQEFQVAATLENGDEPKAFLQWDYKTVSMNRLPTIMMAANTDIDISVLTNQQKFIFDGGIYNLPYDTIDPYEPVSDTKTITELLEDGNVKFWMNSDFRSCAEIIEAAKFIGDGEYQVVTSSGMLQTATCNNP